MCATSVGLSRQILLVFLHSRRGCSFTFLGPFMVLPHPYPQPPSTTTDQEQQGSKNAEGPRNAVIEIHFSLSGCAGTYYWLLLQLLCPPI